MLESVTHVDIDHLRSWIGRKEESEDVISRKPASVLAATLDHERLPQNGDLLGPLWHWVYFTPLCRQSELGVDGHPRLGGFLPQIPLPRRMWAGGRLTVRGPVRVGERVTRTTEIADITHKVGRQGQLVFLTLRHAINTPDGVAIEEEQDIVYREPRQVKQSVPQKASADETTVQRVLWRDPMLADSVLLMRYSALTFNAHRIHYDLAYAQEEEGYPGLVVHGPLIATLLADRLAKHAPGRLRTFSFRGLKPLYAGEVFHLCGRREDNGMYVLWAETLDGSAAMTALATIEE